MAEDFTCAAYGEKGRNIGAVCFVSGELHKRACGSLEECEAAMTAERQRVFQRISELAAEGDPAAGFLEREFASPDQLLGGDDGGG